MPLGVADREIVTGGEGVLGGVATPVCDSDGDSVVLDVGSAVGLSLGVPAPEALHSGVWLTHAPVDSDAVGEGDGVELPLPLPLLLAEEEGRFVADAEGAA